MEVILGDVHFSQSCGPHLGLDMKQGIESFLCTFLKMCIRRFALVWGGGRLNKNVMKGTSAILASNTVSCLVRVRWFCSEPVPRTRALLCNVDITILPFARDFIASQERSILFTQLILLMKLQKQCSWSSAHSDAARYGSRQSCAGGLQLSIAQHWLHMEMDATCYRPVVKKEVLWHNNISALLYFPAAGSRSTSRSSRGPG